MDESASSSSSSASASDSDVDINPELEHSVIAIDVERVRVRDGSGSTGKVLRATVTLRLHSCHEHEASGAGTGPYTAIDPVHHEQQEQQQRQESAPVSVPAVLKLPRSRRRRVIGFGKAAGVLRRELLAFNALRGLQRPALAASNTSAIARSAPSCTAPGSSLMLPAGPLGVDALPHCFGCIGDLDSDSSGAAARQVKASSEIKADGIAKAKVKRKGRRSSQGRVRGPARGQGKGKGKIATKKCDSGACGILMTRARGVHLDKLQRLDIVCASGGTCVAKSVRKGARAAAGKSKCNEMGLTTLVVRIGHRLLRLLRRVHAMGVVHGDLTPSNVLYDPPPGDALSLLDFGHSCVGWQTARAGSRQRGGNRRYVALRKHDAQHKRTPLHPLDDLESMCYVLLDALGRMSWKGAKPGSRAIRRLKREFAERGAAISRDKGRVAALGAHRKSTAAHNAAHVLLPGAVQLEGALAQAVHLCQCAQREEQRAKLGVTPGQGAILPARSIGPYLSSQGPCVSTEDCSSWCECYRQISRLLDSTIPLAEHERA